MALTPVPHRVRSPPMQNTCHPIHRQTCPICDAHPAIIVTEGKRMWRPSADSARPLRPLGQAAAAPENQVIGGDAPRSGSNADGTAAKRLTCSRQAAKIRSLCEAKSRNPGVIEHRRVLGVGATEKTKFVGGIPKRPTGADCKSAGLRLRWFESTSLHHHRSAV